MRCGIVCTAPTADAQGRIVEATGGTKQWQYAPQIRMTDQLWEDFASILCQLNQDKLTGPLSATVFAQVKQIISALSTPYQAGQFLCGLNGVSQVEVDTDDGRHVFLTVFDQRQVGAGDTRGVMEIEIPIHRLAEQSRIGEFFRVMDAPIAASKRAVT